MVSKFHFIYPTMTSKPAVEVIRGFNEWVNDGAHMPTDRNKYLIGNEMAVDRILRYENLSNEVAEIAKHLDCQLGPLQRYKSEYRDRKFGYRTYYGLQARHAVELAFRYELERFQYEF